MTADGVDAVYVVTTHDSHYEYAKLALECGKQMGLVYPFETLKDGIIRTL